MEVFSPLAFADLSRFVELICCVVSEGAAERSVSPLFPMEQIPPSPPAAP